MQRKDPESRARPNRPLLDLAKPSLTAATEAHVNQPMTEREGKQILRNRLKAVQQEAKEGRDTLGRFAKGNTFAKGGSPFARQVQILRSAIYCSFDPMDLHKILRALIQQAKRGNVHAAKLLLDRSLGRMQEIDREIAEAQKYDPNDDFVGDPKYL